mmetsp:Transcript_115498/g.359731  ORF Transcript_115498/g.359731 Transcript_115498/m.359731 type:complete len:308 (-) Transcript_115498:69-992(-)
MSLGRDSADGTLQIAHKAAATTPSSGTAVSSRTEALPGFCSEVPSGILHLTSLVDSLWQCRDEGELPSAPWRTGPSSEEPPRHDCVITRDRLLSMRRPFSLLDTKMMTLITKPMFSGSGSWGMRLQKAPRERAGAALLWQPDGSHRMRWADMNATQVSSNASSGRTDVSEGFFEAVSPPESSSGSEPSEVIVGPSHFAFDPVGPQAMRLCSTYGEQVEIRSSEGCLYYSEIELLSFARGGRTHQQPLSFGSVLHVNGHADKCRPCLFERAAGRCRRLWLCDFCHMHMGRKQKAVKPKSFPGDTVEHD